MTADAMYPVAGGILLALAVIVGLVIGIGLLIFCWVMKKRGVEGGALDFLGLVILAGTSLLIIRIFDTV